MAETLTVKNPKQVSGPPMKKQWVLAADSKTWKAGEIGLFTSGAALPVESDGTVAQLMFLRDQDTSTSSTEVWVGLITADMVFEGFELDGVLASTNRGESYSCDVTSNHFTVDVGDTGHNIVKIIDLASTYEPERNKITDIKGRCTFRFLTSAIDG